MGVNLSDDTRLIGRNIDFGSEPFLITIGKHVTISCNVTFLTHDGATWVFREDRKYNKVVKYGKIVVGNNVFIGSNSIIMPNIKIGDNSIIAAGSVVTKSVPPNSIVGGNPARYISSLENYIEKTVNNCPKYNEENITKNRKEEIIKICDSIEQKEELKKY